jgi:hypothetical protein
MAGWGQNRMSGPDPLHRLARVRTDLAVAGASLEEARGSLGMLWGTTNRLDEDQMARLALLH